MIRGYGQSRGHHGEILQGRFRCPHTGQCPGLVTVPMQAVAAAAVFTPDHSGTVLQRQTTAAARAATKARAAATLTLRHLREIGAARHTGGVLSLTRRVPVGLGLGSSTADVLATIRAVADAVQVCPEDRLVEELCLAAEAASDPLWVGDPVLYAHRHGHVLETLGAELPGMWLLHCVTGGGRAVNTLRLPLCGTGSIGEYEELRAQLREAVHRGDASGVGAVATRSARLNQGRHHKAELEPLLRIGRRCGGVGVQVAHSGNVAGLLFAGEIPAGELDTAARRVAEAGLRVDPRPIRIGGAR